MSSSPTMEDLLAEEASLVLDRFDYASAWDLGVRIRSVASERRLPIAVEVFHGTAPVFFALLPGATPDNSEWIRRKRAVALRFHHSSLYMRLACESKGVTLSERYGLPETEFVASGGAVPIFVRDVGLVGVATVSGIPDVEDHQLVVSAIHDLRGGF
ncbi:heme-degrading domain-containing protein [Rubellimicrobium roseum]|uniref:Heme-degrading domain-containing protein n=1 Tax=Rubellimicrobium roseum TaxID=687525 RepID=A0A5C4NEJ0_9RHOB|nr:heme-degrading domain-containing protein [Rubellimicrobium roseum]TNC72572.1 heme-degrading domain-containing protein [Rubellimicrobium roseum]